VFPHFLPLLLQKASGLPDILVRTRSVSAVHVKPKNFNPGSPKQLLLFGSTW
jgi:hypothetical protein